MILTTLTDEEKLLIFPDARLNDDNVVVLDGIKSIGNVLIDLFEDVFSHTGEELDCYPGAHKLYRLISRDPDTGEITGIKEDDELPIPCVVMSVPEMVPPKLGQLTQPSWVRLGEFEPGVVRMINFPIQRAVDLVFDVYVLRDNVLDSMQDMAVWEILWMKHHFLSVNGLHYRTRVVEQMSPSNVVNTFSDLSIVRGSVEIQEVVLVDPSVVEETAQVVSVEMNLTCLHYESE